MCPGVEFEDTGDDDVEIDMSGVEESSFEVLPKGIYEVVIAEAEGKRSASSNNPMISLTLEVEAGDFIGRKLFTHVVFSPKALGNAKGTMRVLGLGDLCNEPNFKPLDPEVAAQFVGKRAKAKVNIKKYEGEDKNEVKRLLAADGSEGGSE